MRVVERKCSTCGGPIYVYEDYVRDVMYCTLHCMERAAFEDMSRSASGKSFSPSSDAVQNA